VITRALVAGAFAALFFTSNAIADDCKLARLASLDFSDRGAIMIPVSVEGKGVAMVVDTGSVASGIDPVVATNLAIPERRIVEGAFYSLAGPSFTYLATPHDFSLGDMHSKQELLLVWPSPMSEDGSVAGLIATDLLRHYDVDIDFASHKFNLFSQDHCPGKVVYWTSENVAVVPVHVNNSGHVIVPVTLDDHPFDAMLDTGSPATLLNQTAAQASFGLGPASPDMIKVGDHAAPGGVPLYRHTYKSLSLEGLAIGNPTIGIFENQEQSQETLQHHTGSRFSSLGGEEYELRLGVNELRHLHLYIAYKEQKLYITPTSAPVAVAAGSAPAAASSTPGPAAH
jgi:predicted aspartyl protease